MSQQIESVQDELKQAYALHRSGQPSEAEAAYRRILEADAECAEACHLLGMLLHQRGDHGQAERQIARALELKPDEPTYLNTMGTLLRVTGRLDRAIAAFEAAIARAPSFAPAHGNLGTALLEAGRHQAAEESSRKAVGLEPANPGLRYNLAHLLVARREYEEALGCCREVLAAQPGHVAAHVLCATALKGLDRGDEAMGHLRSALEVDPENLEALNNLGVILRESGRPEEALGVFEQALEAHGEVAATHINLGTALQDLGRSEDAMAAYRAVLESNPESVEAHNNLGNSLIAVGREAEAGEVYRRILEIDPDRTGALVNLQRLGGANPDDEELSGFSARLEDPELADEDAANLCRLLFSAWHGRGEPDRAFPYLERANRLHRATLRYDSAADQRMAGRITEMFSSGFLADRAGWGHETDLPIFIVGMPRSGSTLVEQILASHSGVHGAGELSDLWRLVVDSGGTKPYPDFIAALEKRDLEALGKSYADGLARRSPGASRVIDKQLNNFLYIGLIAAILPGAKIIHCRRDALDTCFSCYAKLFGRGSKFVYDLAELGHYYRLQTQVMEHFESLLPGRIFDLEYEELVADQEGTTRRLLDYCGLAWEDSCLAFEKTERAVLTASDTQVRQAIFSTSIGGWKPYRKHLGELIEALGPESRAAGAP